MSQSRSTAFHKYPKKKRYKERLYQNKRNTSNHPRTNRIEVRRGTALERSEEKLGPDVQN